MKKISVNFAETKGQRSKAYEYFRKSIFETYGNYPSSLDPDMEILYLEKNKKIVATIGLYFGRKDIKLPHQKIYTLNSIDLPIIVKDNHISFISRWAATEQNMGMLISYYAGKFILDRGYSFGVCILKPKVAKYLNFLSKEAWFPIKEASINFDLVSFEDLVYFSTKPEPIPYLGFIEQYVKRLGRNKIISGFENLIEIKF